MLDGPDGELGHARRPEGPGGGADGGVAAPVVVGGETELPAPGLVGDRLLVRVLGVDLEADGGEDPAVVGAAGAGTVLVDRTAAVDQHRAVPPLVVAEEDMAPGPPGGREEELGGDVGQRVG